MELMADNIDSNELLRLLPQAHRDAFLAAIKDPESAAARELLQSAVEGGEGEQEDVPPPPTVLPWWEADVTEDAAGPSYAPRPPDIPADVLESIHPPPGVGPKLIYNVVTLAYVSALY